MKRIVALIVALTLSVSPFFSAPAAAVGVESNYSSLVIHDVEKGDYSLGSTDADISILIIGRVTCSRTALVRETVERSIVEQYVQGAQVYLLDIDQPFDKILHQAQTHVINTVYAWDDEGDYNRLFGDARKAARSFNPSTSNPELLPEVLVLDRNCNVIYAFDESVSDYKEKVEQLLDPYRFQPSEEEFVIEDGVLLKYNGHDSAPVIPSNVTAIGPYAFSWNDAISSDITVPNSVTTIGDFAFAGCYKLPNVTIPNGVIKIGARAFHGCNRLEEINIPNSVTVIGAYAFEFCHKLTQLTIPNNAVAVGDGAFYCCENLRGVSLPKGIARVGSSTFSRCSNLTTVSIPNSVQYIDMYAFSGCVGLTEVTIPDSVKAIDMYAFTGCNNLAMANILSTTLEIDEAAFARYDPDTDTYIPLPNLTIYGAEDSTSESYARRLGIPFVADKMWNGQEFSVFEVSGTADYDAANEVLAQLNDLRKKQGLQPLKMSERLMNSAMLRSAEIMVYYDHKRPNGSEFTELLPPTGSCGENIAAGHSLASDVMEGWTNSPGHYRNMTDDSFRTVGIGCFYQKDGEKYWVQLFSSADVSEPATHSGKVKKSYEIYAEPDVLHLKASPSHFILGVGESATLTLWNLNKGWGNASAVSLAPSYPTSVDSNGPADVFPSGKVYAQYPGYATFEFGVSPDAFALVQITADEQNNPAFYASFQDVQASDWFSSGVSWAVAHDITNGTSSNTFSPDMVCTEEQILTLLWRAKGQPESKNTYSFRNADENDYYYKALCWAKETGIIEGQVRVGNPCTRASTVKYMWRYAGKPEVERLNRFSDVSVWDDDSMAIEWAVDHGITTGTSASTFSPDTICTRAQVVTFLYRGRG